MRRTCRAIYRLAVVLLRRIRIVQDRTMQAFDEEAANKAMSATTRVVESRRDHIPIRLDSLTKKDESEPKFIVFLPEKRNIAYSH